jgi:DNA-binding XRE family transcriptional regulator
MVPTADKSAFFSQLLRDWISAKPGRNLHVLARISGLSYTNLRAIESGKSDVTLETALRLLRILQPNTASTRNVFRYFPDIAPALAQLAQQRADQPVYRLLSQRACRAAVEIYGKRRMSCDELQRVVGPGAEAVAQELMDVGLIHQSDDQYEPSQPFFHLNSPDVLIPMLRLFLDNVHREAPWNLIDARFAGLNPEAAAAIQSILEEACSRVMQIKENPENAGEMTVAWGLVMTLF